MRLDEWLSLGQTQGWCGEVVCATHEGAMNDEEAEEFYAGGDPCVYVVRVDTERMAAGEEYHVIALTSAQVRSLIAAAKDDPDAERAVRVLRGLRT